MSVRLCISYIENTRDAFKSNRPRLNFTFMWNRNLFLLFILLFFALKGNSGTVLGVWPALFYEETLRDLLQVIACPVCLSAPSVCINHWNMCVCLASCLSFYLSFSLCSHVSKSTQLFSNQLESARLNLPFRMFLLKIFSSIFWWVVVNCVTITEAIKERALLNPDRILLGRDEGM